MARASRNSRKTGASPRGVRSRPGDEASPCPGDGDLYGRALSEAEKVLLSRAREMDGLDEEIAVLRVRLHTLLAEHPENTELLLKGMGLLVRAVATRYRLSHKAEKDLYQSVLGVLKGIGEVVLPEGLELPEE